MGEILNHYTSYISVLRRKHKKGFTISNKTIKKAYPILFCLILFLSMDIIMADTLGIGEIIDEFWNAGISFLCGLMADAVNFISQNLLFAFPQDMTDFYQYIGGADGSTIVGKARTIVIVDVIKVIAFIFTNAIFIFHLIVCATGNFTEQKNTPLNLLARYAITTFVQIFSMDIADYFIEKTSELITNTTSYFMIKIITANPLSEIETFDEYVLGVGSVLSDKYTEAQSLLLNTMTGIGWLIWLLLAIAILINIVKLTLEIYERYVSVVFLNIGMPLGLCFMTSRTTANITISYFRMYFSQLFLMLFSYISVFIALLLMPNCFFTSKILSMVFLLAYLRMAQKIDSLMGNLGLNVVHTSGNLFDDVAMAGRSMGNMLKGLERGARNLNNAKNNVLDGMQNRALMANDMPTFMNVGALKGESPRETAQNWFNRQGVASDFNEQTGNIMHSMHMNGKPLPTTPEAGSALLADRLNNGSGKNQIPNMIGGFQNVKFGSNGRIDAEYTDNKGQSKSLNLSPYPNLDSKRASFPITDKFGNTLYAQVRDFNEPRKEMNLNDVRSHGDNVSNAIIAEYGVAPDSRMINTASKVKQNDLGDLEYYDEDDNMIGFQVTEDSDMSRFSGQAKVGETFMTDYDALSNPDNQKEEQGEDNSDTSHSTTNQTLGETAGTKADSSSNQKGSPMALSKEDLLSDGMKGTFDGQISSIAKQGNGSYVVHSTSEQTDVQTVRGMIDVTQGVNIRDKGNLQSYFGDKYSINGSPTLVKTNKGTAYWSVPLRESKRDNRDNNSTKKDNNSDNSNKKQNKQ